MTNDFTAFTAAERTYIQTEIKWFEAGAKLLSPSGDDITAMKLSELKLRLEHADKVMATLNAATAGSATATS